MKKATAEILAFVQGKLKRLRVSVSSEEPLRRHCAKAGAAWPLYPASAVTAPLLASSRGNMDVTSRDWRERGGDGRRKGGEEEEDRRKREERRRGVEEGILGRKKWMEKR